MKVDPVKLSRSVSVQLLLEFCDVGRLIMAAEFEQMFLEMNLVNIESTTLVDPLRRLRLKMLFRY